MRLIYHTYILTVFALLSVLAGCNKTDISKNLNEGGDGTSEMIIGSIFMETETKATKHLAVGSTFRLYAFEKGKTSMNDVLTTRTYTITTTDGVPVLDGEQQPLYMPVGEADVYIVGPVSTTILDDAGISTLSVNIATELGVFPRYGADLIASKTTVNIVTGQKNQVTLNPLSHKMARMDIEVSRKTEATYENLDVTEFKVYQQSTSGNFEFGDNGGRIIPQSGENDIIVKENNIVEVTKGDKYKAILYMIPRPIDDMKIEVKFTCNLVGETTILDKRLESGLIMAALIGGKQNLFYSNPLISSTILWRTKIVPWNNMPQDDILLSKEENLIFSYSGLDAPVVIDGQKYWLDRSGNGLHAKIVGDMRYDNVEKCYMSSLAGLSYFSVPDLGRLDDYTLEITIESQRSPASTMVLFAEPGVSNRCLNIHLPWERNTVYFDAGNTEEGTGRMYYQLFSNDIAFMKNFATYYFARNSAKLTVIGRNGVQLNAQTLTVTYGAFKENKLFDNSVTNNTTDIEKTKMKLYSVRLYKTFTTPERAKQHYEADLATYCGIHTKGDDSEYIKNGLILNLDGTNPGGASASQWTDLSEYGNHAKLIGTPVYSSEKKGYYFNSKDNYLKLLGTLGRMQNFTVEFVLKADQASGQYTTLFYFAPQETAGPRVFHMHYPWGDGNVYVDTPWNVLGMTNIRSTIYPYKDASTPSMPYTTNEVRQCSITREYNKEDGLKIMFCGVLTDTKPTSTQMLPEMRHCFVGREGITGSYGFYGYIHAIRVYNRVITDKEKQHNYLVDKKKYNIL